MGSGIDPALMQAKTRAALALSRRAHPLCRIGSAGFAGATGASSACLHDNKCNMLQLLPPIPGRSNRFAAWFLLHSAVWTSQ